MLTVLAAALLTQSPTLITTTHQFGPVGYRDPVGAISPDGHWLVTAAHNRLRLHQLPGGAIRDLPAGESRINHLVWRADGRLLASQPEAGVRWWLYDVERGTRSPLWPAGPALRDTAGATLSGAALSDLAYSRDGRLAGVERRDDGSRLWIVDSAGRASRRYSSPAQLGYPVWLPDGRIACLALEGNRQRITLPCGESSPAGLENREAYGPLAVSPDGRRLYFATPNAGGFVELWEWDLTRNTGHRLAGFARDTYAPSVAGDGTLLFKDQDYHTEVLVMPSEGGPARLRTAFQAETPSWDPTGTELGVTFGTWRRVIDDFRYPDIAQDVGIVAATAPRPAARPARVVQGSPSEDQGLIWSPNRKWIAFHSHQQGSDDIWLRPADRATPLTRLSGLGRGAEVGWPRWSPDGRWIVFNGDVTLNDRRTSLLWIVGVDQNTGKVTVPAKPMDLTGIAEDVVHAEWLAGSDSVVVSTMLQGGVHKVYRAARAGGVPREVYQYVSTQMVDGFGLARDGSWLVVAQPDANGRLQLFRVAATPGAKPQQLTADSTDKTQPAVSPDGKRIAYTAWRYDVRFWAIVP